MDAVNAKGEHILIKGVPGSGKTTVLLSKLVKIRETEPAATILFITYNNTLQKYITESLLETLDIKSDKVDVLTYHKWAKDILQSIHRYKNPERWDTYDIFYEQLKQSNKKHRFYQDKKFKNFLVDELKWIKSKSVNNYEDYKTIRRSGRGVALQTPDRKAVYEILGKYDSYLKQNKCYMWEDYSNVVIENITDINKIKTYDYVFIDEAQDLSQSQLISLRMIACKALIIAADLGQKIYKTDFTWKSTGINVQGGRTKFLEGAFRSKKEVMDLANSLLKHDTALSEEDINQRYEAKLSGVTPAILVAKEMTEYNMIAELITEIIEDYEQEGFSGTIGVLSYSKKYRDTIQYVLKLNGIPSEVIKDHEGSALSAGVKVLTMHGAKGLEFDTVIISGMNKYFPNTRSTLEDDREAEINTARRLVYVSMTRAKDNVYLTYKGDPSIFIGELDSSLYEKEIH
jgi:superfamily I DNA/RNA helicase